VKWKIPVAVYINDTFYSIFDTHEAEKFFLRHWIVFRPEHRDPLIMACLLSWGGHTELAAKAREKFVEAAESAGILICDDELSKSPHFAEAGGTVSMVAGGREFSPLGVFSSGEIAAP